MPVYFYKAGREDGAILTKEVQAESEEALRRELEENGYLVLELKKGGGLGLGSLSRGMGGKQKTEDFLVFNQELLVLFKAGLPIVQSLDILMERTHNPAFKDALADVKAEVRGGKALSDSMARHTRFFPELYTNSLRSGERTGSLADVLERYIVYLKRMLAVKRQLISAVTYPALLIAATVALLTVLLTYVVPSFSEIYVDFKADLPLPTVILMNVTRFIRGYILFFISAAAALVVGFRYWYRTDSGRRVVDAYLLRVPLVGGLIRGYIVSTLTRTLGTILAGGIPMLQALEMVARSVTNREVSLKLRYAQERVRQGISLAGALEETGVMPPMTIRMVEVGEATGALERMLDDISTFYEEEVNVRVQRLTNLIEPVIMLSMGLVVGAIVIVMYLPIFELAGTVK
ncbi:MAG TPA: type II secretion system F family protein [Nitrospirota bacterium]|nr:type II secretion system F family protein [Nitrospirota bacterium]